MNMMIPTDDYFTDVETSAKRINKSHDRHFRKHAKIICFDSKSTCAARRKQQRNPPSIMFLKRPDQYSDHAAAAATRSQNLPSDRPCPPRSTDDPADAAAAAVKIDDARASSPALAATDARPTAQTLNADQELQDEYVATSRHLKY